MALPDRDIQINFSDLPILLDFDIYQTADFEWRGQLTYTDEDGTTVNVDLSDPTSAKIYFEQGTTGDDLTFDLSSLDNAGKFAIALTAAETDTIPSGMHEHQVKIVLPVGNTTFPSGVSLIIFRGIATVHAEVSAT